MARKRILPVKETVYPQDYTNPNSNETLIRQTAGWPMHPPWSEPVVMRYEFGEMLFKEPAPQQPMPVPDGFDVGSAYLDAMARDDRGKYEKAAAHLSHGMNSRDEELIAFCSEYFDLKVVAVRTVYFYDLTTFYDCPRVDFIWELPCPSPSQCNTSTGDAR